MEFCEISQNFKKFYFSQKFNFCVKNAKILLKFCDICTLKINTGLAKYC